MQREIVIRIPLFDGYKTVAINGLVFSSCTALGVCEWFEPKFIDVGVLPLFLLAGLALVNVLLRVATIGPVALGRRPGQPYPVGANLQATDSATTNHHSPKNFPEKNISEETMPMKTTLADGGFIHVPSKTVSYSELRNFLGFTPGSHDDSWVKRAIEEARGAMNATYFDWDMAMDEPEPVSATAEELREAVETILKNRQIGKKANVFAFRPYRENTGSVTRPHLKASELPPIEDDEDDRKVDDDRGYAPDASTKSEAEHEGVAGGSKES